MARFDDLPLFPLGVVLLPDEVLPLHIFEPRYRELVARCLDGLEPFCIVLADDEGVRSTGCLAQDIEVLERFDDGRLNIAVTGGEPVAIDAIDEEAHAYLSAAAHTLPDDPETPAPRDVDAALEAYRGLVSNAEGDEAPPEPQPGPRLSYAIAGRIDFGVTVKQQLLEKRSEVARLSDVTALIRGAARTLAVRRAIAERAKRNGRVSAPDVREG
jgi:Lon protease-like protein